MGQALEETMELVGRRLHQFVSDSVACAAEVACGVRITVVLTKCNRCVQLYFCDGRRRA